MSFALPHKAETAWKPSRRVTDREPEAMDNLKTQETLRNLWGILNELAPENFDKIVKEATDLSLDTEERLKAAVEMIFDNFLSEQSYDVDHAIMCFRVLMVSLLTSTQSSSSCPITSSHNNQPTTRSGYLTEYFQLLQLVVLSRSVWAT